MFVALLIPNFELQAVLRHEPELHTHAIGLIPENASKPCIIQTTAAAAAIGVVPGMTLSQGLARCRELVIKTQSTDAERSARAALRDCAWAISPFVEETRPGLCTIVVTGAAAADYESWLARLEGLQLFARIGAALNADLALLTAQSTDRWRCISHPAELGDLSIEAIEASPEILGILNKWGIRTLGAFVALGREALVQRLGPQLLPLFDRAAGLLERPLRYILPAESFEESITFESEIETLEPLLFILHRFLGQLTARLEMSYRVAADITLRLGLTNGTEYRHVFKIPSPTRDLEVLFRMLHTHLENFRATHPIISLHLLARPTRGSTQQFGLFESALRDPNQFYETLARLAGLVGHDRVGTPQLEPIHKPDAFRMEAEAFGSRRSEDRGARTGERRPTAAVSQHSTLNSQLSSGLLLRRFRPPIPALVQAGPRPAFVQTCQATGAVSAAYGPMLLSGDWWNGNGWSRCEWDVQLDDGPLCRIYEEAGRWFLEGVYD